MRMKASALLPGGGGSMTMNWVAAHPVPAMGDGGGAGRRQAERGRTFVEHDEIVPAAMPS